MTMGPGAGIFGPPESGRHEHALRQRVLALTAGSSLDEHEVLARPSSRSCAAGSGLTAWQVAWEGCAGDLLVVSQVRHALQAVEGSAVLLTVSKAAQACHP